MKQLLLLLSLCGLFTPFLSAEIPPGQHRDVDGTQFYWTHQQNYLPGIIQAFPSVPEPFLFQGFMVFVKNAGASAYRISVEYIDQAGEKQKASLMLGAWEQEWTGATFITGRIASVEAIKIEEFSLRKTIEAR